MKELSAILAKSFVWTIISLIIAFPIALVPLVIIEFIIEDFDNFMSRIDNNVLGLYMIFVVVCFIGILVVPLLSSAIKFLFIKKEAEE